MKVETEMMVAEATTETESEIDFEPEAEMIPDKAEPTPTYLPESDEILTSTVSSEVDRIDSLRKHEREALEYKEFSDLFPDVKLAELPDSVNESVRSGVPLAAAYALYRFKKEAAAASAATINEKNREKSFSLKKNDSSSLYYSPAEVREMSPAEVKANYSKIIDSMSHWH